MDANFLAKGFLPAAEQVDPWVSHGHEIEAIC